MNILIVDDHPIVRAGLCRLLRHARPDDTLHEVTTGKAALTAFRDVRPDVVILDLNLPDIGGLEVAWRIRAQEPNARILVLSMHHDAVYVTRALQAGVRGYLSKNAAPEELLEAVSRVAAGDTYVEQDIAQELVVRQSEPLTASLDKLSRRDIEILRQLTEGRPMARIAEALGVSQKTVANRCTFIKNVLGASNTADLVRLALKAGLSGPTLDAATNAGLEP